MSASTHRLIALTGYAESGKDSAATVLIHDHDFVQESFAKTLKQFTYDVDPFVQRADGSFVRYAQLVDEVGVDIAKRDHPDVRRLIQRMGTEGGRKNIHPDVWVDAAMARIHAQDRPVVITDARFPNEVAAVRRAGGILVRIDRPGHGPVNTHVSDTGIAQLNVDHVLVNDASLEHLQQQLVDLLGLV